MKRIILDEKWMNYPFKKDDKRKHSKMNKQQTTQRKRKKERKKAKVYSTDH